MANQIFVNLPVADLNTSVDFFTKLGFSFNPKFTNENATCMIISENIFAMLLVEKFFKTFITKEIADSKKATEVLLCISVESRQAVDDMVNKANEGGKDSPIPLQDHGWMYSRSFEDPDGHIWEVMYADETAIPENPGDTPKNMLT